MKSSYQVRALKCFSMLLPYIVGCHKVYEFERAVRLFNQHYHRHVMVDHGLTRIVFITSDYAIKIDYGNEGMVFGGCEEEVKMYETAKKDGFGYLFAAIERIECNGYVAYVMPRVRNIPPDWDEDAEDSRIIENYLSDEECRYLFDHVRDVHWRNFGLRGGRPVIVDYACLAL